MKSTRRIAVLMGLDLGFCRNVVRGIRRYAEHKPNWVLRHGPPDPQVLPHLREWKPDGILANTFCEAFAASLLQVRRPVIDTSFAFPSLKIPTVDVDHDAVGRLAAEYFLERKFTHFAYMGSPALHYAKRREAGFSSALAERGFTVSRHYGEYVHAVRAMTGWNRMDEEVVRWLRDLPKPVAVLASNDAPARCLVDMALQLKLHIPDDVAVLGVDNDELECTLASPPLSSIAIPAERIGYEAARLLDLALEGEKLPKQPLLLPPLRVVTRQSTDTMAVDDPMVRAALHFIHQHAADRINVGDVVRRLDVCRREVERRFRRRLGHSVLAEIHKVCVERAKQLLHDTDLSVASIAKQSGFSTPQRLAVVFAKTTGRSPTAFRRQARLRDAFTKNRPESLDAEPAQCRKKPGRRPE